MYRIVLTLILVSVVSCFSACKKQEPMTDEEMIVGKWTMKTAAGNYTVNGVNRKETTTFTASDNFTFKADGTLQIVESKSSYSGNWKITNKKLYITNTGYIDFKSGFDLQKLTAQDLQIFYTETSASVQSEQVLTLSR